MNLIQACYEIIECPKNSTISIERAARTCYKSEDKTTGGSAERLTKGLIDRGHHAMVEFGGWIVVKFSSNRGFTHELVRHRIASFAQESTRYCVAGRAALTMKNPHQKYTVEELYQNKVISPNGAWKKINILQFDEKTNELIYTKVRDIILVGMYPVITITTHLGYTLTLTPDHQVRTDEGYTKACDLLGKRIAVNGTDLTYQNCDWLHHQYNVLNKTAVQIGKEFGWTASVVKKWTRKYNLPKKPASYWNKEKPPWNKGLTKETDTRVAQLADSRRAYTEGLTSRTCIRAIKRLCEICGSVCDLNVHHIDQNRENNNLSNLMTLCVSCHQRVHAQSLKVVHFDEVVSVEKAPVTEVYDLVMNDPNRNFVANGIVVHNCNYSRGKFNSELTSIDPSWMLEQKVKDPEQRAAFKAHLLSTWLHCELRYMELVGLGCPAEIAREGLPIGLKAEIVIGATVREWRHIFTLRCSKKAHLRMRELMVPLREELRGRLAVVFDGSDYDETEGVEAIKGEVVEVPKEGSYDLTKIDSPSAIQEPQGLPELEFPEIEKFSEDDDVGGR